MGPIVLFDKSFLQSLSLDESVWFDHFFLTNVSPLFFVETLADLNKPARISSSPEDKVRIIADKFPVMNSGPSAHHADLALSNLVGYEIPMRGQILLDSGRLVSIDGKPSVIAGESPVAQAFARWQDGDFNALERGFASEWRQRLSRVDMGALPELLLHCKELNPDCSSLSDAKAMADTFTSSRQAPYLKMEVCLRLLEIPPRAESRIRSRWARLAYPCIHDLAPYASFQLSVILFFFIALRSSLISSKRPSTLVDIAYLFYLPFCMVFVSSDRLHREAAPLFLRENQEFVWGPDLKASLREINLFFSLYHESERDKGLHAFAPTPPLHVPTLVSDLWDRHLPGWRESRDAEPTAAGRGLPADFADKVKRMENAPTFSPGPDEIKVGDIQSTAIKRRVRRKKGAWYQIPRRFPPRGDAPDDDPIGA